MEQSQVDGIIIRVQQVDDIIIGVQQVDGIIIGVEQSRWHNVISGAK